MTQGRVSVSVFETQREREQVIWTNASMVITRTLMTNWKYTKRVAKYMFTVCTNMYMCSNFPMAVDNNKFIIVRERLL